MSPPSGLPAAPRRRPLALPSADTWRALFSPGVAVIASVCVVASLHVLARPRETAGGMALWTFGRPHLIAYQPIIRSWNADTDVPVSASLLDYPALERRVLSGFLSGTPLADLVEVERGIAARTFAGPLDAVGFVDLTDRLREEGLLEEINAPSFSPWTTRGRVFGLPHDVHPVLLAYRADLVEAAGIDVSGIETWDDFERVLGPLQRDLDGDGRIDRRLINFWPNNVWLPEAFLLQAGGRLFDANERPALAGERNAEVLVRLALWVGGPRRIALDAPEFSAAGNQLRLDGLVVASILPDWLAGVWKTDLPGLAGKIKLMPLPAWERGGRRTTVMGGTMLGIPKATPDFERAWRFAKHLYLSPELAAQLYEKSNIITPVKRLWTLPVYDRPDPYFGGQPAGRLYIEQAAAVPARVSSPYAALASTELGNILLALQREAEARATVDPADLLPLARRLLAEAQARLEARMDRNVFLNTPASEPASPPAP